MQVAVVKGPRSRLAGAKCADCHATVKQGEVVLWAALPLVRYGENRFVVHTECVEAKLVNAPVGRAVRAVKARWQRARKELARAA